MNTWGLERPWYSGTTGRKPIRTSCAGSGAVAGSGVDALTTSVERATGSAAAWVCSIQAWIFPDGDGRNSLLWPSASTPDCLFSAIPSAVYNALAEWRKPFGRRRSDRSVDSTFLQVGDIVRIGGGALLSVNTLLLLRLVFGAGRVMEQIAG